MKILRLLLVFIFVVFASCNKDESALSESTEQTSVNSKKELLTMSRGKVTKHNDVYHFRFENNKGASIDLEAPTGNSKKGIAKTNNDYGMYTDNDGNEENLYYSEVTIKSETNDGHLTGSLTLRLTPNSEAIVVNFYDLTTGGYFFTVDFLFLPIKIVQTSKTTGFPDEITTEQFFYDNRARINRYTLLSNREDLEEKLNWGSGKIRTIDRTNEITTFSGQTILIDEEQTISYDSNGSVAQTVTVSKAGDNAGKTTDVAELVHNAESGALEYSKSTSFNPDGTVRAIFEFEFINDADNNHESFKNFFAGADGERGSPIEVVYSYEKRMNYQADLKFTTPNRNLLSTPEEYFGPKNRTKDVSSFESLNSDGEPIAVVNNLDRVFTYDVFGFPKKVDEEFIQTVDGVEDPRKTITEKTYKYQLAIIFKPLEY